jgi:hypothetical protein
MDSDLELVGAPGIVASPDGLVVVYEDGYPPTKYIRRSADFGESWSVPVRPFPHIGGYGRPALVTDSAGNVHLIVGNRLPSPETYGMWYSQLVGEHWLPLQALSSGPAAPDFGPCCGQAVMVSGNLLLAAWAHNVSSDFLTGAWSAYTRLDVPTQTPASSVGASSTMQPPTPSVTRGVRSTSTPIPPAASSDDLTPPLDSAGPLRIGLPIYVGIVPVMLLAAYLMFRRLARPAAARGEDGDAKGAGDSDGGERHG